MGILERGLAILRMRELASTAKSVNSLVQSVRGLGLGYRNTYMWRDASNAYYGYWGATKQEKLDLTGPLAEKDYIRGDWQRPEYYKMYGVATWYDPATGLSTIGKFSMFSGSDMTDAEMIALWAAQRGEYEVERGIVLTKVDWLEKWHKIGAPYRSGVYEI